MRKPDCLYGLWKGALTALLLLLLAASGLIAQTETAQLSGVVTDPTGAVVPNAKVTVKSVETGVNRVVNTSASGVYAFPDLRPGSYDLTVTSQGFSTTKGRVTLTVGARTNQDFKLEVGQTSTVVEVEENAATVNTVSQTLGSTVTSAEVLQLPTISRDPYALVGTVGNVSSSDPSGRGVGYAINGQRSSGTNVMLDGTANNDEFTASAGQRVPLDSVQEFSVLTNNFTAEFGRASAGIVNVATKSGTNDYHGAAYWFGRYSKLASNDFNDNANGIPKSVFTRNQFGYSIGGPVLPKLKNKLFFFNNTEWIRVRSNAYSDVLVPSPQLIALSAPATQTFFKQFGGLRTGLVNLGTYTKGDLTSRGVSLCPAGGACAGLPDSTPMFNRVAYGFPSDSGGGSPQNTYMTVGRVDYNLSDKTQMYVRYSLSNELDFAGSVSNSPYAGYDSPNTQVNNSILYSLTRSFSPTFISQSKVDFNRFNNQQPFGSAYPSPTLYLGSATVATSILGNDVALPGYDPYTPGNSIPFGGPQNFVELYQDFSKVWGNHTIKFGANFTYLRDNRTFGAYETAVEALGNKLSTGMENFLQGQVYQFQAAIDPQGKFPCASAANPTPGCTVNLPVGAPNFSRSNRYKEYGLYAEDAWRITERLTLNYGLRWEIFGPQHNKDASLDSNFYLGSGSNVYQQIAAGQVDTVPNSPIGSLWNTAYTNFGPRIGIAYDLFGDGKTSLRGGYGRYFERNFGNVTFNVIQNPPNYAVVSLYAGSDLPTIPISTSNAGPLAGSSGAKALPAVSLRAVNPNIKTAYVDSVSAALEHRFGDKIITALEYSMSRGQNQYSIANINETGSGNYYLGVPCTPGTDGNPGTCTSRIRSTQYSSINFRSNGGTSSYDAMNLRLDWRGKYGLNVRANYTWSHAIDDLSDVFSSSGNQFNLGGLDAFNPAQDRGNSYYDMRQRLTFSGIWNIPFKANSSFAKYALQGWSIDPILTIHSGSPYSLFDCTNGYNVCPYAMFNGPAPSMPNTALTPTATPNNFVYYNYTNLLPTSWYNPKTGISDFGPYPNSMIGRNFFYGPGAWNLDLAIHKTIPVGEKLKAQLRLEGYNFFNHPNLAINGGDADVSSASYMDAYYTGRRFFQVALRLDF
jgi:outer membrane receptor protein involved in Fe transport